MEIKIYTDGACVGNPGPGGWAAVVLLENEKKELFGGEKLTTNNRMELMATIKALEYCSDQEKTIERKPLDDEPFSALAFKIMTDPYVGRLTFFRVYSGSVSTGYFIYNPNAGKKERVGRLMLMHANKREERDKVVAGEIVAVVGLKNTNTGHTVCDEKHSIILEAMGRAHNKNIGALLDTSSPFLEL